MTADVYAGDDDQRHRRPGESSFTPYILRIRAERAPDTLLRIAMQLNLLNCLPLRLSLENSGRNEVVVEAHISGCADAAVDLVCRKLDRLTCAHEVTREIGPRES